jgi:hypothetical protein
VIGVLSMTVELGHFAELHADGAGARERQVAVLVDCKPDESERAGRILEHPFLATVAATAPEEDLYLDADRVQHLERLRVRARDAYQPGSPASEKSLNAEYVDPVGGEYDGRWLAAEQPVMVDGRETAIADTGWAVIVQERYQDAIQPVGSLGDSLVSQGRVALGAVLALVLGLWLFVAIVFNEAPRRGLFGWLRRRTAAADGPSSSTTHTTESRRAR